MPHPKSFYTLIRALFLYIPFFVILSSCEPDQFLFPQPVDKNNIEEFPRDFRGCWSYEGGEDFCYQINRKNVSIITRDTLKILSADWQRLTKSGEILKVQPSFIPFSSITYDSLKKRFDTSNYVLSGNLIFKPEEPKFLKKGHAFYTIADSIYILKYDTFYIDLGRNAFLRRLNKNFYMLNILNRVLGESAGDSDDWWQLVLLEKNGQDSLSVWEKTPKLDKLPCMFYPPDNSRGRKYYNCAWTTDELLRLIKEGYFELSTAMYREKN